VWPENWAAVRIALRLATQWRMGFGGQVGLVYDFPFWLDLERVPRADWPQVVDDVQAIEAEMLRLIREKRG
jgi:hypothetical protein